MGEVTTARPAPARWLRLLALFPGLTVPGAILAQAPGEIQGLQFAADAITLSWTGDPAAEFYNVYRAGVGDLAAGQYGDCHATGLALTGHASPDAPLPGQAYYYLVTGESTAGGEGPAGNQSGGSPRAILGGCTRTVRAHVQNRLGYGGNEWSRARIALLGPQGYMDEQLAPASISEADNTELNTWLGYLDPPENIIELIARQVVSSVHARRQLEQQMALFWANHFSTFAQPITAVFNQLFPSCANAPSNPACDPSFPDISALEATGTQHREIEALRALAFGGTFRQMLGVSAKSPAMIIYLDGYLNKVGTPNENHAREVMELHSMGVNGGYTQEDVEVLARIMTGWTICKKSMASAGDPLAGCITNYWEPTPAGQWTSHFVITDHDCGPKTLFAGTPQQITFPGTPTCSSPADAAAALAEFEQALDAIAAHPATPQFISTKILQLLVTDEPTQEMVDALVAEWNDAGHPQGIGDMREVTRAALSLPLFLDLAAVPAKVKTPLEHFASAFRAVRGRTDGFTSVLNYLVLTQHIPFYNLVPTGYSELGEDWVDTNNMLERQNFGVYLIAFGTAGCDAAPNPDPPACFGSDPVGLLTASGISTAPGNATAIVEFYNDILFAGTLLDSEKQMALDYLLTADDGTPDPNYNNARIRGAVGLMLGFAQYQNQ